MLLCEYITSLYVLYFIYARTSPPLPRCSHPPTLLPRLITRLPASVSRAQPTSPLPPQVPCSVRLTALILCHDAYASLRRSPILPPSCQHSKYGILCVCVYGPPLPFFIVPLDSGDKLLDVNYRVHNGSGVSIVLIPQSMFVFRATSDRKSTRLNSSHSGESRMPSSA